MSKFKVGDLIIRNSDGIGKGEICRVLEVYGGGSFMQVKTVEGFDFYGPKVGLEYLTFPSLFDLYEEEPFDGNV